MGRLNNIWGYHLRFFFSIFISLKEIIYYPLDHVKITVGGVSKDIFCNFPSCYHESNIFIVWDPKLVTKDKQKYFPWFLWPHGSHSAQKTDYSNPSCLFSLHLRNVIIYPEKCSGEPGKCCLWACMWPGK